MKLSFFLLILVLSCLTVTKACAQHPLVVTIDSSNYVAGCDDSTGFLVTITNTGTDTLISDTLKIYYSNGIYWTSTDGPSIGIVIPITFVYSTILPGQVDTFSYYVKGTCSLLNQGNYHDSVIVSYDVGLTHYSYSFFHDFQVESPHLVFNNDSSVNMSVDGFMGETFTRKLFLKNDGDAPLVNGQIAFKDSYGSAVAINSIQIIAGSTTLTTSYTNSASATIPLLDHGDSILILENITVVGCLDSGAGNSFDTIRWGCFSSLCDTIPVTAIVYRSTLRPLSFFTVTNDLKDSSCEGSWKHWHIAICDTSLVPCQHFSFLFSRHGTQYSLIDADSITVTRNHTSIHFDSLHLSTLNPLEHFYTNTCYSAVGNNPLDYIQYYYDTLKKGDTIFMDFDTYKCCGNDTNNLFIYGSAPVYAFNDWYIKLHWSNECDESDSSSNYISPHDAQGYLQLVQEFQPQRTDMNGSHTQWANADSASFFITNTGFTNLLPDSFYRYFNKGYLMVKIKTDLGLRYKGTVYFSNYNNTETWYPYRVDSTIGDTVLINQLYGGYQDSITAYFRFDTLTNFDSLYYFLIRSQINFQLYSYCNAAAPRSRYTVETMWRNDTACTDCLIPLNRQGGQIQVHCPGCEIPGFVATSYSLSRISKGEKDDNNDGIMDSLTPATDSLINHSRGIVGDTLVGTLVANIVDGYEADSIHGATLVFVEDSLFHFDHCYLHTILDYSNHFRIFDVIVTITDSSHVVLFSQNNLTSIVEHNYALYGNKYLYDLSLGTLQSHGLDTAYRYSIGDIFTVVTKYRIDSNTLNTQVIPDIINITNTIYLTGIADDLFFDPVVNYPTAGDVNAAFGRDSLKPKDLFWCEAFAGLFYQYPVNIINESVFYNAVSNNDYCNKFAVCEAKSLIGGNDAGFTFPFEYRQPPVVDTIRFILPSGYLLDHANSFLQYPFWEQPYWYDAYYERTNVPYNSTYFDITLGANVYLYVVPPYYSYLDSLPSATTYLTDSVPIADEIFDYKLYVYITPTCGITPENTYIIDSSDFYHHNLQPQMVFSDTIYHFLGPDSTIHVPYNAYPWQAQVLTLPHPTSDFVITSTTQTVSQQEVCWDFFIQNTSIDDEPMENVWASLYSPSGRITIDTAFLMPAHISLLDSNGIIHLDNLISADSIVYFEICCHYSCDTANVKDSMVLYYGWNCFNYPDSISQPDLCNRDTAVFRLIQADAAIQWAVRGPDTITNCDTLHYQIIVTASELGSVYDFTATVYLPYYFAYLPGSGILEYPADSLTPTVGPTISGDSLYWNLDSTNSLLHTIGIGDGDSLVLYFELLASCGYSGDSLRTTATITGITFCGDTLRIHPWFPNLVVTNCSLCCHLITSYQVTNVSCNGGNNGQIIASVSDGTGPYSYIWSTIPIQTTATATGLTAGTYSVIITDSTGCSKTDTIVVSQPPLLTDSITYQANVLCFGGNSGKATVTAYGGTIPYSYSWNTLPVQTNATATNLSAGTYTVTVTDANGCTTTATVIISQPDSLIANITAQTNVLCFGDSTGTATASASGGTAGYTYLWNTIPPQNTYTVTGLTAGTYTVTVTDTLGCMATTSVTITQPDSPLTAFIPITSVINDNCFGDSTGRASVTVNGGTPLYSYVWSTIPTQTTDTAVGLIAGNYTVTVTDSNGCSTTATTTVAQPPPLLLMFPPGLQVMDSCYGLADGRGVVFANGGTPLYSYLWSSGSTDSVANSLAAGVYTVTVTDSHGCTATSTDTITQPPLLVAYISDSVNVLCNGGNNGSATVSDSGGTVPYFYSWNTTPVQHTNMAVNLTSGTYTVTVTDLNGCSTTASVTISQPPAITISFTFSSLSCYDTTDISIIAHTIGGTSFLSYPYYFYSWNTIPIQTTDTAIGLGTGMYIVTVTDSNNCIAIDTTIIFPFSVSITGTNVSCIPNASDGTATVTVTGGALPYTYLWSNGETDSLADSLSVGLYFVTVTDSNGCSLVDSINISGNPACCYNSHFTHVILHDTTFTSSYIYPSGSNIAVTGNITVMGPTTTLSFTGCNVQLAPGVSIDIFNVATLKIDSSHLYAACDTMWREILIERGSKLIVTNNSLIEDADTAVHSIYGGLYFIDHSEFNKDYIGIYLDATAVPDNHSTVENTNFYCKDTSGLDDNLLLYPHFGHTNIGIKVANFVDYPAYTPLVIGGAGVGNNFEYLDYGIVGENSTNTDIVNNNFKFIFRDGIWIDNKGYADVEYYNTFELCQKGVHTTNFVNTSVKLNQFKNCVYGVETFFDQGATLDVEIAANTFKVDDIISIDSFFLVNPFSAVWCHIDDGATHNIYSNAISNDYDNNMIYGILCEQTYITTFAQYNIFYNKIYNCTYGIFGSNLNNPLIYEQDSNSYHDGGIYVQSYPTYIGNYTSGIILEDCYKPQVYYNNITGQSGNENYWWMNCGIRVENSNVANIYCNETGNVSMGLWLGGYMPTPVIKGNIMDSCWDQMFLNYNPGLGVQGSLTAPSDNEWTTTPVDANTNAYYSNPALLSTYFYTRLGINYTPVINNFFPFYVFHCYFDSSATGSYYCTPAPDAIEYSSDERGYESRIAGDSIPWGDNLAAYTWLAKQYLYSRFKEDSTLAMQNSVLRNAKDSLSQTNIAAIKTVADTITSADTLIGIDSLSIIQDSILRQQELATATSINNAIDPGVTIEQNYKMVYTIFLNTVALGIDTFTDDQHSQLVSIAEQCPYSGGPAVYSARVLLHIIDTTFYAYNACDNFNPNNNDRIAKKDSVQKNVPFGKLFPDPNNGNMQFDYYLPIGSTGELKIFDVLGNKLATYPLITGINSLRINQTDLSPSVYMYKVIVNNCQVLENKIVILK